MCDTCGCGQPGMIKMTTMQDVLFPALSHHDHHPGEALKHIDEHKLVPGEDNARRIRVNLEQDILLKNSLLANVNREFFKAKQITAFNLVSSPGSGKTALLENTLSGKTGALREMKDLFYVIEGDQQTTNDAERIMTTGVPVIQINTGKGCHLDAQMIADALVELKPVDHAVIFIENIGNLVCPSMFDLGEQKRIVIVSVTEGEDKPLKYPDMFAGSQLCIINKIDLLPYLKFDLPKLKANALKTNPHLKFLEISCSSGEGLDTWYQWLKEEVHKGIAYETYTRSY